MAAPTPSPGSRPDDTEGTLHDTLVQAAHHHQAGRLEQADALYRAVLRIHPDNPDAHHNLGVLAMQTGRGVDRALPHFRTAWEADPAHAQHGLSYLRALVLAGNIDQARRVHADGVRRGLSWPTVETLQGGTAQAARTAAPAAGSAAQPTRDEEEALAKAYAQKDHARFETLARSMTQRYPGHGLGWKAVGFIARLRGRREEAVAALRTAARLLPRDAETHGDLGSVLLEMGLPGEAETALRRAAALQPGLEVARLLLGEALLAMARLPEAEIEYREVVAMRPNSAGAHCGLGRVLVALSRTGEAEECFRRALSLQPGHPGSCAALGALLVGERRVAEAEALCREMLDRDPSRIDVHYDLGTILTKQGRLQEASASYRQALALRPDHLESRSCLLFLMNYAALESPARRLEESRVYGAFARSRVRRPFAEWKCDPAATRLRVGLVSGDLREHPVGYFLESALAHANPARIEWFAYPTFPETDALSGRLRARASAWNSLVGLADEDAARRIHEDGIHVLLDLSGHTVHNRLPVFAWRPAPVQVTWPGYFATTGLAEIDYILADRVGVPPEHQSHFTETVWYLPDTRLCFTPPAAAPEPTALPALANGFVTFGCFQAQPKITNDVLETWGRILASCPRSRLRLQNESLSDPAFVATLERRLADSGVDPARVDLHGFAPRPEYLKAHAQVDLLLDTFPYPGGTTTCESLWMGVPTLTLAGDSMIARQGASLLTAARLAEFVTHSREDYVARAIAVAGDLPRLAALRASLRDQVRASPLFDAPLFARNLEEALHAMWNARGTAGRGGAT